MSVLHRGGCFVRLYGSWNTVMWVQMRVIMHVRVMPVCCSILMVVAAYLRRACKSVALQRQRCPLHQQDHRQYTGA